MIIRDLFKTSVAQVNLNIDLKKLESFCLNHMKKDKGRHRSNPTGYQSNDLLLFKETKELQENIQQYSKIYLKDVLKQKEEVELVDLWFNLNKNKDYNMSHCHPKSKVSGCFYVSAPKDCGNIVFTNPSPIDNFLSQDDNYEYNHHNSRTWFLPALAGCLYIFPSWIFHHVEPNLSKKTRISFAFNIK
jgi:uncharacterized protein (TIGR02466 family)